RLRGLHQALAGYRASGHVSGQAAIYNNLSLAYRALGLYRLSNRMSHEAIAIRRRMHDFNFVINGLSILGGNATLLGDARSARAFLAEVEALRDRVDADGPLSLTRHWLRALIALEERDGAAAVPNLEAAFALVAKNQETSFRILVLIDLCQAHLLRGATEAAL